MNNNELEQRMRVFLDIKKAFHFDKTAEKGWHWSDRDVDANWVGPFATFWEMIVDATEPYEGKSAESATFQLTSEDDKTIEVTVKHTYHGLEINLPGYGSACMEDGCGTPLYLDFFNGFPVLYVWGDINNEEPERIDLEGALESKRVVDNSQPGVSDGEANQGSTLGADTSPGTVD